MHLVSVRSSTPGAPGAHRALLAMKRAYSIGEMFADGLGNGFTRPGSGATNAHVLLALDPTRAVAGKAGGVTSFDVVFGLFLLACVILAIVVVRWVFWRSR